ncbi:hypothetical protein H6G17_15285 [Chroococcidiopsis sp. FACHB-1243]|uniref:hypothetical protein n=1 Tax=Chroococcidiopsis sp. [FACHB-1243] TaxID=2692781 RepID=UPI0017857948|nr:hypothetical protein [Chroococcidiopsis sp. [FACHB-1243]]MBD2306867.1 hypothetical protein [Chroococcidiopsis sp. [FACHB-1243]]
MSQNTVINCQYDFRDRILPTAVLEGDRTYYFYLNKFSSQHFGYWAMNLGIRYHKTH